MNFIDRLIDLIVNEKGDEFTPEHIEQLKKYVSDKTKGNQKEVFLLNSDKFKKSLEKSLDGSLKIKVVASTGNVDRDGDLVIPEGIRVLNPQQKVPFLLGHDHDKVLGYFNKWYVNNKDFIMEGYFLMPSTSEAYDAKQKMIENALDGISIGFIVEEWERDGDIRVFTKTELLEASLVSVPSNRESRVLSFSEYQEISKSIGDKMKQKSAEELAQEAKELESLKSELETLKNENQDLKQKLDQKDQELQLRDREQEEVAQVLAELNEIKSKK